MSMNSLFLQQNCDYSLKHCNWLGVEGGNCAQKFCFGGTYDPSVLDDNASECVASGSAAHPTYYPYASVMSGFCSNVAGPASTPATMTMTDGQTGSPANATPNPTAGNATMRPATDTSGVGPTSSAASSSQLVCSVHSVSSSSTDPYHSMGSMVANPYTEDISGISPASLEIVSLGALRIVFDGFRKRIDETDGFVRKSAEHALRRYFSSERSHPDILTKLSVL
ncbi:hypothetical protein N7539_002772 [Penicillium diatomitis]|uniref:Uncharacterized protein n=1 Tax=Penicillium diatomitis TaxID=2819901 RepID=A0A9W9XFB9_9EURO|nr:uncharacterized protein N7539_002772 [Penicillium diatomitis]KAJ5491205.1 hypothetical protein N7539_002772 [Penicillium diatomitis]